MRTIKTKVIIADNNYLTCKGLTSLIGEVKDFVVVAEVQDKESLEKKLKICDADIIVIDYSSTAFKLETLLFLNKKYSAIRILAITPEISSSIMAKALNSGITSHLLKDCDKEEIIEALRNTVLDKRFLCGKIVDRLMTVSQPTDQAVPSTSNCVGVNVTERETEIIKLIAEGYSNKEIAERLFLSTHTVTTHRKNIMAKLGVNNTAGVVLFAVRENLLSPNKFLFS